MNKLLKNKSILCKKKTKKASKKVYRKSRIQRGGNGESLTISYNGKAIINDSNITGNIDYDYSKSPQITINGASNDNIYLITLTDPDAPNGLENKLGNFTYTHWVFTQKGNDNNTYNEIVSYVPPSPPKGTHRYIFKLYDVSDINMNELNILKVIGYKGSRASSSQRTELSRGDKALDRKTYFINKLKLFIKNNIIKLLFQFQFIVKK